MPIRFSIGLFAAISVEFAEPTRCVAWQVVRASGWQQALFF
jgi:hypothetical protein